VYVRNASLVAANGGHKEICGTFFERSGYLRFLRAQNKTVRPCSYSLESRHLLEAEAKASGISGVFHSHPISEANPSNGDVARGPRDGYAIIYDLIGDEFRLWRVDRYQWVLLRSFDFDRTWLLERTDR